VSQTLDAILGYRFTRSDLPREALTHRSALQGKRPGGRSKKRRSAALPPTDDVNSSTVSNERLEFIGDRVLGLLIAEWLAERFPDEQEGDLGRRLAALVSQPVLAQVAETIGLGEALTVAPGEARAGVQRLATVLADALEAALGAIYLDGGLEPAREFVRRAWDRAMTEQETPPKDAKNALQEWAQKRGLDLPAYKVSARSGPPHAPVFEVTVTVGERGGTGTAGSKRVAEQLAAESLYRSLPP
jgi:ribonuclease-3